MPEKGLKHLLEQLRTLMAARQLEADKVETGEHDEAEERQNHKPITFNINILRSMEKSQPFVFLGNK